MENLIGFEVGKTYTTRSACDYNCIISITVLRRTAKTITTEDKTFRVSTGYDGFETVKPWGRGSMMPIISAYKGN